MNFRKLLFALQLYIHVVFIVGLFLVSPLISIPAIIVCQIVFVGLCGTVFYHRVTAHKNAIIPSLEKVLLLLSWIGASGSAIAWTGTHRVHHRFTDTERDPHSPSHHGALRTYWLSSGDVNIIKYVPDLLRKPWFVFQHKYYFHILGLLHVFGILLLPFNIYWCILIVPAFLMWFAGSTVNVFCHNKLGPLNVKLLGYIHAGEGFHANHHAFPGDSNFNHKYDWGSWVYQIIKDNNAKSQI